MAGPEKPKVTGCVEGMGDMALQPKNLSNVARTRLVYHRYLFYAMGMQLRPKIRHVGAIGHDKANDEVTGSLQHGQDQVSVP